MFGKATLQIPGSGDIGPSEYRGLSDELAMAIGRRAATTLSEHDGFVVVTLSDKQIRVIGNDTIRNELIIGRLPFRTEIG